MWFCCGFGCHKKFICEKQFTQLCKTLAGLPAHIDKNQMTVTNQIRRSNQYPMKTKLWYSVTCVRELHVMWSCSAVWFCFGAGCLVDRVPPADRRVKQRRSALPMQTPPGAQNLRRPSDVALGFVLCVTHFDKIVQKIPFFGMGDENRYFVEFSASFHKPGPWVPVS